MKLSKQEKKYAQIAGVAAIIILAGYFMCWWGGPHPLIDAQWCPNSCWMVNTSDSPILGYPAITCPPIDDKLRQTDNAAMNQGASSCIAPATWTETDTLISCNAYGNPVFNCNNLLSDASVLKMIYDASIFGAKFRCQPDWVGFWCPGSGPLPYPPQTTCGYYFTSGDPAPSCGGPCPQGTACTTFNNECMCLPEQVPEVYTCGQSGPYYPAWDGPLMCSGTCPDNGLCMPNVQGTVCSCAQIV